jgi:hypothetical protein
LTYIARPPYCISSDSPQERNGFEISVPRCLAIANSVSAFISAGEWRLLESQKQLYRFTADDRSDDSAAPIIDRPQPDRSLETGAYLARNWNLESISLQEKVCSEPEFFAVSTPGRRRCAVD